MSVKINTPMADYIKSCLVHSKDTMRRHFKWTANNGATVSGYADEFLRHLATRFGTTLHLSTLHRFLVLSGERNRKRYRYRRQKGVAKLAKPGTVLVRPLPDMRVIAKPATKSQQHYEVRLVDLNLNLGIRQTGDSITIEVRR